jgi:Cu/Ag efflux protein CusF
MKFRFGMAVALALLAHVALAAGKPSEAHDISFTRTRAKTISATVEAINHKTREVTLKGPDGKSVTFKAGERVKNLDQVKKGDLVTADYYESTAVYVSAPDAGATSSASVAAAGAEKGEMPAGIAHAEVTLVAMVEAIASDKKSVTLKKQDGGTVVFPVKNPENLEMVKVGDQVTIVSSQTLAVLVEKGQKSKPKSKK